VASSRSACQNGSSRVRLVLCPDSKMDRLGIWSGVLWLLSFRLFMSDRAPSSPPLHRKSSGGAGAIGLGALAATCRSIIVDVTRIALVSNPATSPQARGYVPSIETAARSLGLQSLACPLMVSGNRNLPLVDVPQAIFTICERAATKFAVSVYLVPAVLYASRIGLVVIDVKGGGHIHRRISITYCAMICSVGVRNGKCRPKTRASVPTCRSEALLLRCGGQQIGARLRNSSLWRDHAGECCPAALLDEGVLLPRIDLFQFDRIRRSIGCVLELVDAYRCKSCHDSATAAFLRHLPSGTAERPSAPVEADDYGRDGANGGALQQAL
jgi:hypothetical protein